MATKADPILSGAGGRVLRTARERINLAARFEVNHGAEAEDCARS